MTARIMPVATAGPESPSCQSKRQSLKPAESLHIQIGDGRAKYGLAMRLVDIGARLTGRFHKRAYIGVKLTEEVGAG